MEGEHAVPTYHALLIGIDTYQEKPLQGAARDVREIRGFLEQQYPSIHITSLVASHHNDTTIPNEGNPTWSNVTSVLEDLGNQVGSGDGVYIHFSGHGSCWERNRSVQNTPVKVRSSKSHPTSDEGQLVAEPSHSQSKRGVFHDHTLQSNNVSTNDLALNVLADNNDGQIEYLYGYDLAIKLKLMVDKGAVVTLALDCCYSGCVVRDDEFGGISRFQEFDPKVAERSKRMRVPSIESLLESTWRDSSMLPNWIVNPIGYSILTACGAQEKAYERYVDELTIQGPAKEFAENMVEDQGFRPKQGVFSFYLLETLSRLGQRRINQQELNLQLCALLRAQKLPQNPTFYGTANTFLFGSTNYGSHGLHSHPVIREEDSTVRLLVGEAHGVLNGDIVLLRPFSSTVDDAIESHVKKVQPFTSVLQFASATQANNIETGWCGSIMSGRSFPVASICLADDLPFVEDVRHSMDNRNSIRTLQPDSSQPPFVRISQLPQGQLAIHNEETGQEIELTSKSFCNGFVEYMMDLVEHLGRYEWTKRLAPKVPQQDFQKTHIVKARLPNGVWTQPHGKETVQSGETVAFEIRNKSNQNLYVHVYGWGPLYQVTNNVSGSYIAVPPKSPAKGLPGFARFQVQLTLPVVLKDIGQKQCRDLLKVIVTSHPTDLQHLIMPALLESAGPPLMDIAVPKPRGSEDVGPSVVEENWAVYDFIIDTVAGIIC